MSLPVERYVEIDAELQNIQSYFNSLADELSRSPDNETLEFSASAIEFAARHITYIRQMLKLAEQKSEARSRRTHLDTQ